ncbi:MAG: Phosphoglycerate kinase [Candidatus Nomurabacteria bacterium GW2011_GWE1_32_28]|uniref:Phosphoglycerate kinase n=1 Tax=Candidatus Nomurabacteria bacterium GW2011_GWF1_31_48 TaxID=1618767 RepID=A0A0G0BG11_9BACT|nr:MAG: Phosphoglycerate kinase [Candidatus Nomurabacteria bacterium GW2011_GWF2_30_133]KKP28427.1 MAG: Phosphoglycerate kinase [Candidatus Nomurabacteria bacterium GW2011_GWE2_31_40]KKP30007.1 MAG: Phosphoglycerate kinase [Candidatus Nomurabacteria bacterium GW2011_GWF1_31_48]KKP34526.1 MAG: Phosphoglycerate kinase [Candidatus Nomurabacteria bacterium GW2011_GWE1_32_28]HAS81075.1 phosphoglycerate kinase [Candidatus Nomurabacteria bacterium]
MRSIKQIKNLKNKKVLVRVDFNVPIKNGIILDDFRIKKSLPTIKFLINKGANVLLMTHLGKDGSESLEPIIKHFFKISKISKNRVSFFENIRKFEGETKNDKNFAKEISKLGDIYVNDAFSVSHRNHASILSLPKYLPSYAGFQLEEEVKSLSRVIKNIKHPFLYITGGAKFSTKLPLIKRYIKTADYVFVGGALGNTLLKKKGCETGISLVDSENYDFKNILKSKKIILPKDVLVSSNNKLIEKNLEKIEKGDNIIDIGENTVKDLTSLIKKSKLILWNGPLGEYEKDGGEATKKILKIISKTNTESIIGGGDIVSLISKLKLEKKFTFVSTGGGATLDFLSNGTLPGIKALK